MRDMLLVQGTRLHKLVEKLLLSDTIRPHLRPSDIFEAEKFASNARSYLFEQMSELLEQRGEVVFEHVPEDGSGCMKPAWRCSLIISDEVMQFAVMGNREVYRRFVDSIVDQVCDHVRNNTKMISDGESNE